LSSRAVRSRLSYDERMSGYRRWRVEGGTFFFTVVTYRRQRFLTSDVGRSALREAFRQVRRSRPFKVVAIVLLPDHLHTVWELPRGDTDYTTRWRQIKTLVTRALVGRIGDGAISASRRRRAEKGIWQRRFYELRFIVMCDLANTPSSGAAATHGMAMNSAAWNDWCVQARTLPGFTCMFVICCIKAGRSPSRCGQTTKCQCVDIRQYAHRRMGRVRKVSSKTLSKARKS